jgi:ABC-type molybdate transport system substrate-binding protein
MAEQRTLVALACVLASSCSLREELPNVLRVFADASLREPCAELGTRWEAEHPAKPLVGRSKVFFEFGASDELAREIVASRRADVVPAD